MIIIKRPYTHVIMAPYLDASLNYGHVGLASDGLTGLSNEQNVEEYESNVKIIDLDVI